MAHFPFGAQLDLPVNKYAHVLVMLVGELTDRNLTAYDYQVYPTWKEC